MNSEESRIRSFNNWPENAAVDLRRIAAAGFYYMGLGLEVQCFSCGARISEWNIGDSVMARHRALDPSCPFVLNPNETANIPLVSLRGRSSYSQDTNPIYQNERSRLETYAAWPINHIVSPAQLAKSGFYYTLNRDKVRCAYCMGVVERWVMGDEPDREHRRLFPNCSFIRNKMFSGTTVTRQTGINIRNSDADSVEASFDSLKELGVQDHRIPRHTKFSTYDSRLNTFSQWPPSLSQKPHDLAEAGFYFTGRGDQVRCFHCDGGLRLWEREDNPWLEHARWFPSCGFILLVKGQEFIDEAQTPDSQNQAPWCNNNRTNSMPRRVNEVTEQQLQELMGTEFVRTALQMGIEASRVKQALKRRMEAVGVPFVSPEMLVIAALEIQSEQAASIEIEDWGTPPNSPLLERWRRRPIPPVTVVSSEEESEDGAEEQQEESFEVPKEAEIPPPIQPQPTVVQCSSSTQQVNNVQISLEEENRRLKEARLCKICMDSEVGVVFLPCRHLVTCANCALSLLDCPLCRQSIKATVKTFLS